jgi:hypothetical protein
LENHRITKKKYRQKLKTNKIKKYPSNHNPHGSCYCDICNKPNPSHSM